MHVPSYDDTTPPQRQCPTYGLLGQYTCGRCNGDIFPDRPPIYNPENCSCDDLAPHSYGAVMPRSEDLSFERPQYSYGHDPLPVHQPESFMTDRSIPGQEGIENHAPTLHTGNDYIQTVPQQLIQNEPYTHENIVLPYTMQHYLQHQEEYNPSAVYGTQHIAAPSKKDDQWHHYSYIQPSTTRKRNNKSKPSTRSSGSGDDVDQSWSWHVDSVAHTGGWVDGHSDIFEVTHSGQSYPYETELPKELGRLGKA